MVSLAPQTGPRPLGRGPFRSAAAILAGAGIAAAAPTLAGAGGLGVFGLGHGRSPSLALWRLASWRIAFYPPYRGTESSMENRTRNEAAPEAPAAAPAAAPKQVPLTIARLGAAAGVGVEPVRYY